MTRYLLQGIGVAAAGVAVNELTSGAWHEGVHYLYVGVVAALVIGLHRAFDREHALARTDALTGVPNRRTFEEVAAARIERMRRDTAPCTVVYLDIDGFKQVNDRSGHAAGDALLRQVGATLSRNVRGCDTVARLGGDEFAVLLEGDHPGPVIARLRTALRTLATDQGWPVGFSIGAVTFREAPETADEMLRRTDAAMYVAKQRGGAVVYRVA